MSKESGAPARATGAGPPATFEQVYDEHADFVWRSIRRLGLEPSAADDALQQVFLVVHRRLSEFEGTSSMRTWLFGILLRVVRDHRRTLQRKSPHLRSGGASGGAANEDELLRVPDSTTAGNPERALSRAEASRIINELLDTLDDDKRAVFVLAELEQMQAAEIAQALGMDAPAVYSRLRAARTDFERAAAAFRRRALGEHR
jgi:RNA polymerase sigma-70 factor (ECF subfamily)